ncbi:MAG: antibiotic biosynthesis monooxygenase [Rhodothermales bacterium]|nr:antibiotic biosynthesis monooxygenase [Rhodothermales bacterium]
MGSPLVRIVRLTLRPDAVDAFREIFEKAAPVIRSSPGCISLELWADARFPNIVTTHSRWENAEALEHYRSSPFFRQTWARTKTLFAAPPFAASHVVAG